MAFTEMSDTEMATSTLIQAIETSLNPSTDRKKRAEAYEVNNKLLFPTRNESTKINLHLVLVCCVRQTSVGWYKTQATGHRSQVIILTI